MEPIGSKVAKIYSFLKSFTSSIEKMPLLVNALASILGVVGGG